MAKLIRQRNSLHRQLADQRDRNKKLQTQIGRLEPLANIGMVSAMVAHEINNILTPISSYAQLARENPADEALTRKTINKTLKHASRAARILDSLLSMANGRPRQARLCPLKELIEDVFACIARDFSKDSIQVQTDIPDDLMACVEEVSFQQMMMNLILNAREAMLGQGGRLHLAATNHDGSVTLKISDTGCGIHPDDLDTIFEPFFTTKDPDSQASRAGAGLGLALVKRVVETHRGEISVDSTPGSGTTFTIKIPAS